LEIKEFENGSEDHKRPEFKSPTKAQVLEDRIIDI